MRILIACVLITMCNSEPETARIEVGRQTDGTVHPDLPTQLNLTIVSRSINYTSTIQRKRDHLRRVPVFTLKEDITEPRDVELDKSTGFYHDVNGDSSFCVRVSNSRIEIVHGYFYYNGAYFTISPMPDSGPLYHVNNLLFNEEITRRKYFNETGIGISQFSRRFPFRNKRQVQLYEVELCLSLDYSIYKRGYNRLSTNNIDDLLANITLYYSHIVNSVDSRFRGIRGSSYVIKVLFAGLFIAQDPKMSPWVDLNTKMTPDGPIVSEKSLKALADWSNRQGALSNCDHVMGLTAINLAHEGSVKTLGLSRLQSMCGNRSYSIIEDHGNIAYVSLIASHELAHSLGAKHDGMPTKVKFGGRSAKCSTEDGYIMKSRASSVPDENPIDSVRRWLFSPCSSLYFDFYIDYLDSICRNCLVQRDTAFDKSLDGSDQSFELLIDLDYYCETIVGSGSVLLRRKLNGNFSDVCQSVPCSDSSKSVKVPVLATEGLKCGPTHACHLGKCKTSHEQENVASEVDRACPYGDQAGVIQGTGQTCDTLISTAKQAFRCYEVETECCKTCYRYRRQSTSLPACRFGDRGENCTSVDCCLDTFGQCCETCAVRERRIAECPEISVHANGRIETNTETFLEGSVATFFCNRGYTLLGTNTSVCVTPGLWTSGIPKCIQGCREIHPRQHSTVRLSRNDNAFGTEAQFACRHNLTLMGHHTIVCQNDTRWSGEEPRCGFSFTSVRHLTVAENSDPSIFTHQLATGGTQSTFSLVSNSSPGFSVSRSGRVTSLSNVMFNYEQIMTYRLLVEATCIADLRLKSKQHLIVGVTDVNDPPMFSKQEYQAHIWMPIPKGGHILQVSAIDEDSHTQEINFSLAETRLYKIDRVSGRVTSLYNVETDTRAVHVFTVIATDSGIPSKSASAVIKLCIGRHECDVDSGSGISMILSYNIFIFSLYLHKQL